MCLLIGIVLIWSFLIWELIFFIYCGFFVLILVVFVLFLLSLRFGQIHLWPSSGDLPRPRIGMLSLVTVSPVITAFHSCCLSHHVFWPSKPRAGLGRIWNRYLLTILTFEARGAADRGVESLRFLSEVAVNHLKKARVEIWPKRSERRNNTKTTKMRTKSPQWIKN